jgi:hypothetical protein
MPWHSAYANFVNLAFIGVLAGYPALRMLG